MSVCSAKSASMAFFWGKDDFNSIAEAMKDVPEKEVLSRSHSSDILLGRDMMKASNWDLDLSFQAKWSCPFLEMKKRLLLKAWGKNYEGQEVSRIIAAKAWMKWSEGSSWECVTESKQVDKMCGTQDWLEK